MALSKTEESLKKFYATFDTKAIGRPLRRDDQEIVQAIATTRDLAEASRKLCMHRNSVLYRINKIHRETGLDARIPIELFQLLKRM